MSESNTYNRPIISVVISPKGVDDRQTFQRALSDLARQDPTIRIKTDSINGQTIISGMGEIHLQVICDRIVHEYKVPLNVGKPKVIYLETIREPAEAEGKYIRQTSGRVQYAHVKLRLEPRELGSGYQFVNEIAEGATLREFVDAVDLGIQEAMKSGILVGHEMVDLRAVFYDGSYHVEDSNEMAFKIAASMAFKDAARKASPIIVEPVMSVGVVTPEDFVGTIMSDLSLRRGQIEGMEPRAGSLVIHAIVPLAEMFGCAMHMRLITQGRAEYSMHFARYEAAPRSGESEGDEAGITANKPKRPKAGSGFAAAKLGPESE
jgi:elongation factor G